MRRRRARPNAVFELGVPVLGICYGMQTMAAQLGGRVAPSAHREFGYAKVRRTGCVAPARRHRRRGCGGSRVLDVWMSHGDRVEALPPGFAAIAATSSAPLAAMANDGARALRRAVPPGSDPYAVGTRRSSNVSCATSAAATRSGMPATSSADAISRVRAAGRPGTRAACAVRRSRLLGGRGAPASRDRRPAHLRLRGSRPAAPRRGRPGHGDFREASWHSGDPRGRGRPLLHRRSKARRTRSASARSSAGSSSRCSRRKSKRLEGVQLACAGHDLSRRDRVGGREDRQGARDQVASQRRRAAGPDAPGAPRAAARAFQGRSPPHRRSSSDSRARWCSAIRSRVPASAFASSGA